MADTNAGERAKYESAFLICKNGVHIIGRNFLKVIWRYKKYKIGTADG